MRMDIGSLVVSVRLNDLTYLASSVSAYLLASIYTDVCTYTHIMYIIHSFCSLFLLLPHLTSSFSLFHFSLSLAGYVTSWHIAPCMCAMSLWLHTAMLQSILSSKIRSWTKDVPAFSLPDMWRHCLSREKHGKKQAPWWWHRKWEFIEC